MPGQFIPSVDIAIERDANLTFDQKLAIWRDLMDTCELVLRGSLRERLGRDEDVDTAFREWYERQMDEHDRDLARMAHRFKRCLSGSPHAV